MAYCHTVFCFRGLAVTCFSKMRRHRASLPEQSEGKQAGRCTRVQAPSQRRSGFFVPPRLLVPLARARDVSGRRSKGLNFEDATNSTFLILTPGLWGFGAGAFKAVACGIKMVPPGPSQRKEECNCFAPAGPCRLRARTVRGWAAAQKMTVWTTGFRAAFCKTKKAL